MRVQLVDVVRQHGSHRVLAGVTLQIGPRTRLGVVGQNGSGKSTLLRLLAGLEEPTPAIEVGRGVVSGTIAQQRGGRGEESLLSSPSLPARPWRSSASAQTTSVGPGQRSRRESVRGHISPSCKRGA